MMALKEVVAYVLISVSGQGAVSSSKYDTLHLCQEAESLVKHGQTLEEVASSAAKHEERVKQWYIDHPPRQPTAEEAEIFSGITVATCYNSICKSLNNDGTVQDDYPWQATLVPMSETYTTRCLAETLEMQMEEKSGQGER